MDFTAELNVENTAISAFGNDVLSVTSSNANFEFTAQYSDVDMSTDTDTLGNTPVSVSISSADAKQGLAAQSSTVITATVSLELNISTCSNVTYVCFTMDEGSGASHRDADTSLASNVACYDVTSWKTCAPG